MISIFIFYFFIIPILFYINWWLILFLLFIRFFYYIRFFHFLVYYSSIRYCLGGDLLSLRLIFLTIWIIILIILASTIIYKKNNYKFEFIVTCFILLLLLILSFSSYNLFIFYLFFESRLIPTLFLIFGWGYQPERLSAGIYLLFYTLFASLPMLVGVFYIYIIRNSLFYFYIKINVGFYIYLSILVAFLVKIPIIFFHFWLPKAHVEAPVSGSIILAGVLLKLGGYGLFRVLKFIVNINLNYSYIWISLRLFGIFLVGTLCLSQTDIKSLIAYSSVGHIGIVICGLITINYWGLYGSLIMIIAHGLCSSGLFALANIIYERSYSRSFYLNKGLIIFIPNISFFWFLLRANNIACPPSLNLLGEIILINRIISWCNLSFIFLSIRSFLSCCYRIYLYSVTQHGGLIRNLFINCSGKVREYILVLFHWIPLNFIILNPSIFTLWFYLSSLIRTLICGIKGIFIF